MSFKILFFKYTKVSEFTRHWSYTCPLIENKEFYFRPLTNKHNVTAFITHNLKKFFY